MFSLSLPLQVKKKDANLLNKDLIIFCAFAVLAAWRKAFAVGAPLEPGFLIRSGVSPRAFLCCNSASFCSDVTVKSFWPLEVCICISIPQVKHLRLNDFKNIYRKLKTKYNLVRDWLLLGLLVWIEEAYIDYKIEKEIDGAIESYLETVRQESKSTVIFKEEWNDKSVPLPTLSFTDHVLSRNETEQEP